MELLIIWLVTVVVSIGFDLSLGLKMFKDVADQGYKIDTKKFSEIAKQLNPEVTKMNRIAFFIPVFNLLSQLDKLMKYEQARPFLGDQLRIMDCITPFTKEEEENYNKKPTGLNAMITTIKSEIELETKEDMPISYVEKEGVSISFIEDEEENTIWFKIVGNDLNIIKTSGPVSRLPLEEQKKKLKEILAIIGKEIQSRMTTEQLGKEMKKGGTIDLSKMPVKEELKKDVKNEDVDSVEQVTSSTTETKQQLEQLRDYVVSSNIPNNEEEKGHAKVLKPNDKK